MTHEEIILWIQQNVIGINNLNGKFIINYFDQETGLVVDFIADSLLDGVLQINEVELTFN